MEKVRKYDREWKKNLHNRMEFTSQKASPSPTKVKSPSYYKVLSTSKKVQNLLGPSPKTHTTILKHLLNKAIRSPRKSKYGGIQITTKKFHDASEGIGWETIKKSSNTEES